MACASLQVLRIVCNSMPESVNITRFRVVSMHAKVGAGSDRSKNRLGVW